MEPGVSIKNPGEEENNAPEPALLHRQSGHRDLRCRKKGEKGFVTGSHGGVDDLLIYFPRETLEKMTVEDKVQVRMQGRGMKIQGFEDTVHCISVDPQLFEKDGYHGGRWQAGNPGCGPDSRAPDGKRNGGV